MPLGRADENDQARLAQYLQAAAASHMKESCAAILAGIKQQAKQAHIDEVTATQAGLHDASRQAGTTAGQTSERGTATADRDLTAAQDGLMRGDATVAQVQHALIAANEIALKTRIVTVDIALTDLLASTEAADDGLSAAIAKQFSSSFRGLPQLIDFIQMRLSAIPGLMENTNRELERPTVVANAGEGEAFEWHARAVALAAGQKAFAHIAGHVDVGQFLRAAYKVVKNQNVRTGIVKIAGALAITIVTSGMAAEAGAALASTVYAGEAGELLTVTALSALRTGAVVADIAMQVTINSAVQYALSAGHEKIGVALVENLVMDLITRGLGSRLQRLREAEQNAARNARTLGELNAMEKSGRGMSEAQHVERAALAGAKLEHAGWAVAGLSTELMISLSAQWAAKRLTQWARGAQAQVSDEFAAAVAQQGVALLLGKKLHGLKAGWEQRRAALAKRPEFGRLPAARLLVDRRAKLFADVEAMKDSLSPIPGAAERLAAEHEALLLLEEHVVKQLGPAAGGKQLAPAAGEHAAGSREVISKQLPPAAELGAGGAECAATAGAAKPSADAATVAVSSAEIPAKLASAEAEGATVTKVNMADGHIRYQIKHADGKLSLIVTQSTSPVSKTAPISEAGAAKNQAYAKKAKAVQDKRDGELGTLVKAKQSQNGFVEIDHVVVGAGQGAVMDVASLNSKTNVPGTSIKVIPSVVNIAPQGSMFDAHKFPIGQRPLEFPESRSVRHPAEFQSDRSQFLAAENLSRSLNATSYESGMVTYKAEVVGYETKTAANLGGWKSSKPNRLTLSDGTVIYAERVDLSVGLGAPRNIDGAKIKGAGQLALENAQRLVHAQNSLHLPAAINAKNIAIVGDGPSAAWAIRDSLANGVDHIVWLGFPGDLNKVPAATRDAMRAAGMTDAQIGAFSRGWNECNGPAYDAIKSGKVELLATRDTIPVLAGSTVHIGGRTVDGVVMATGSVHRPIAGMEALWYRLVKRRARVVALEAVDSAGTATGVRKIGTEVTTISPERIVADKAPNDGVRSDADKIASGQFRIDINDQANQPTVPSNFKGVPGSLYQNSVDIPLANQDQ